MRFIGGLDKMVPPYNTILTVSGGFTTNVDHIEHNIIIGDVAKTFVKSKVITWDSFKSIYFNKNKLAAKHYPAFIDMLNTFFPLPIYTVSDDELLYIANKVYMASDDKRYNAVSKLMGGPPSNKAVRHLFMIYKHYLEVLIEQFIGLRNEQVPAKDANDFKELLKSWIKMDVEYGIDTSSPILYFNFPPKDISIKQDKKLRWKTSAAPAINDFIDKSKEFVYLGFCPFIAIERLLALLKFPLVSLLDAIRELDGVVCDHTKVIAMINKIKPLDNASQGTILRRAKLPTKFPGTTPEVRIPVLEKYAHAYLTMYKDMLPELVRREKNSIHLAQAINGIASEIKKFEKII
jgi:hypothetical protein